MTDVFVPLPRFFWILAAAAFASALAVTELPRTVAGVVVPVENTHATPEALAEMRRALEAQGD